MNVNLPAFSADELKKLINSPEGARLLRLIRGTDSHLISQALQQASGGDYAAARETLSPLLASPEAKEFMKNLEE